LKDILSLVGRTSRTKFRHQVIDPMIAAGLLEMTHPNKARSRLQKFRTTDAGRARLAQNS
jgi:ATP-dependent DNA helicase RecG